MIPNNQGGQPGEQANEILKIFKHWETHVRPSVQDSSKLVGQT